MEQLSFEIIEPGNNEKLRQLTEKELALLQRCPACNQKIEKRILSNEVIMVLKVFKIAQGFDKDDKLWDKTYHYKYAPMVKRLIGFLGSWEDAADCIQDVLEKYESQGFRIFRFQTILEHAQRWKLDKIENERNSGKNP